MKGDDGVERGREERVKGGAGTTHPQRGPPRTFHRQTLMAASSSSPPSALPTRIQSDTGTRRSRSTSSTVCGTGGGRGGGKGGGGRLPQPQPSSPRPPAPRAPPSRYPPPPGAPHPSTSHPGISLPPELPSSPCPPPRRCPPGSRTSLRRAPSSSSSTALPAALSVAVLTIRTLLNVACTERNERGGPKARPPQTASPFAVGLARCPVPPHRSEEVVVHRSEDVNGDAVAPLQPPQGAAQLPAPRVAAVLWGHGDGAGGTDPPRPPPGARIPTSRPHHPPHALQIRGMHGRHAAVGGVAQLTRGLGTCGGGLGGSALSVGLRDPFPLPFPSPSPLRRSLTFSARTPVTDRNGTRP